MSAISLGRSIDLTGSGALELEAAIENDSSPQSARSGDYQELCGFLNSLVTEEAGETQAVRKRMPVTGLAMPGMPRHGGRRPRLRVSLLSSKKANPICGVRRRSFLQGQAPPQGDQALRIWPISLRQMSEDQRPVC
jgi:hypothetical protein